MLMMILANVLVLSLYGVWDREDLIDVFAAAFVCFFSLEVLARVVSIGPSEYWNWAFYHSAL